MTLKHTSMDDIGMQMPIGHAKARHHGSTRYAIYDFIVRFTHLNGFPPTIREIAHGVGVSSPGTVSVHLNTLEKEQLIKRYPDRARAIFIVDKEVGPCDCQE